MLTHARMAWRCQELHCDRCNARLYGQGGSLIRLDHTCRPRQEPKTEPEEPSPSVLLSSQRTSIATLMNMPRTGVRRTLQCPAHMDDTAFEAEPVAYQAPTRDQQRRTAWSHRGQTLRDLAYQGRHKLVYEYTVGRKAYVLQDVQEKAAGGGGEPTSPRHHPHRDRSKEKRAPAAAEPVTEPLRFESRFESGNLARAMQVGDRSYHLKIQNDINTKGGPNSVVGVGLVSLFTGCGAGLYFSLAGFWEGWGRIESGQSVLHTLLLRVSFLSSGNVQWFYFAATGGIPGGEPYAFRVTNYTKSSSLFNNGNTTLHTSRGCPFPAYIRTLWRKGGVLLTVRCPNLALLSHI